MGHAGTWPFPVLYKVVKGASPQRVVAERAEGLLPNFIEAAKELEALGADINKAIGKKGAGVYQIPGLCKIVRKQNPARPAREGTDPRTGEKVMFKPKPASTTVKVRALKSLKDMVK